MSGVTEAAKRPTKIGDIFEMRIEEKIDPVIKVAEVRDEAKLASEIGSYVVTPMIEKYIDEFLEHYTNTFRVHTTEVGSWISGYFGSGKSALAKILRLLLENRNLQGHSAGKRFETRIPPAAPRRASILGNLKVLDQCATTALAFNINTIADSRTTPLPKVLLSQYYQSRGYSSNLIYARVIEQEIDRRGKLQALHQEVERLTGLSWADVHRNPGFYARQLYTAACNIAPDAFRTPEEVAQALKNAEKGELYNVQFLVRTMLDDLDSRQKELKKPARILLVLDETGQWIEDDASRLAQLQALVEEAAVKGQGKIWIFVTTHEDMGAVYQNARALQADMKKIEGRFRFKWSLTTENIEMVLQDRIFRKRIAGGDAVGVTYDAGPGVLRGLGELANASQKLPTCERDRFITFYPFFPYQVHLIPEIVKSLRSRGGRGEQLSGSTRTLLAITQDILRAGRRPYLSLELGELVSFDEVYGNLAGEGEVSPDVRRELSRIEEVVPEATALTRRVAEVLFLIREMTYVPRTIDNVARLLVESTSDDLSAVIARVKPELEKLISARVVARIGEEYEFLTGERRTFEDEVATVAAEQRQQDREAGLAKYFVYDPEKKANNLCNRLLGFQTVPFKGNEFEVRISMDGAAATRSGDIQVHIHSPLAVLAGIKVPDLEDQSLGADEQSTIFVLCDRVPGFDQELNRFLAMREVINRWKSDPHRSEEARRLAMERESDDLAKLQRGLENSIKDGIKHAHVIFRGSSRTLSPKAGKTPGESLRAELETFWPTLYPKFEKVPVRVVQENKAIIDVLSREQDLSPEVRALRLFDKAGALDPNAPLLDAIRIFLATRQTRKERTLGHDLLGEFSAPPCGWDRNAVRVGVAACVRAGVIKVLIGKMPHTNPADPALQKALRDSREFEKAELVLEEAELSPKVLEEVRTLLIKLTGKRKIDETPVALHEAMETFGQEKLARAQKVADWADPAGFPLPQAFQHGKEALESILALAGPIHRVKEVQARATDLSSGVEAIEQVGSFRDKWRAAFVALRAFAGQLRAVENLLPSEGRGKGFLGEYQVAEAGARFAEPDVWKTLQAAKAAAEFELQDLLNSSREEARRIAEEALSRIPGDLELRGLEAGLCKPLGAPLDSFIAGLDGEKEPARAAALPTRSRRLVDEVGRAIQAEVQKRQPPETRPPKPTRQTQRVRLADVLTVRRVTNEAEWNQVRPEIEKGLDGRVRELLRDFDVELE